MRESRRENGVTQQPQFGIASTYFLREYRTTRDLNTRTFEQLKKKINLHWSFGSDMTAL